MAHFPHGAFAAVHAAQKKRRDEELEEEQMTIYRSDELDSNWEFKIVRSSSGAFRKNQVFQTLLAEEALAGWELVEKLDDRRVRFKRPRDARRKDASLPPGLDPYRTQFGPDSTMGVLLGLVLLFTVILGAGMLVFFVTGDTLENAAPFLVMMPAILVLLGVFLVIAKLKSRS